MYKFASPIAQYIIWWYDFPSKNSNNWRKVKNRFIMWHDLNMSAFKREIDKNFAFFMLQYGESLLVFQAKALFMATALINHGVYYKWGLLWASNESALTLETWFKSFNYTMLCCFDYFKSFYSLLIKTFISRSTNRFSWTLPTKPCSQFLIE